MTAKNRLQDRTIEVMGLRKTYGKHVVLDSVDFSVGRGEIYALLGPNGAGKTTTINILSTLIKPDAGTVSIGGVDVLSRPQEARRMFALTGQYASVDEFQTGAENLAMMARLSHLGTRARRTRVRDLLEAFDLRDAASKRVADYSGGMRRRLDLAISLIAAPPVLFLDEPTTGLDPRSRAGLWSLVAELAANGTTILLTTQYLEEAERLAHRVGVIDGGTIVASGTPAELKAQVSGDHLVFSFATVDDVQRAAALRPNAESDLDELAVRVPTEHAVADIRSFLADTADHGVAVTDIAIAGPSLDDVFLTLTGHEARTGHETSDTDDKEKAA
ncbi:MAG TPA: ATP-binding cassette domain-containing protein [Humibacter sp.]|nr:ATP-binding cassette domain-containing protein [Humibacter sp.]